MRVVLRLPDDWVWDSWVADDGERYHLFFLKAPRSLREPRFRHTAARIGHATSADLTHWDVHADALAPAAGGWDDLALWTGSVARGDDGVWRLYYSGLSTSRGLGVNDQRIGMAESDDLFTWRRIGDGPLVAPDARWYATLEQHPEASATWRDPFVFKDPAGDGWHMLITARAAGAPRLRDGVVGPRLERVTCARGSPDRRSPSRGRASASSRCPRSGSSTDGRCSCSPATPISRAPSSCPRSRPVLHVVGGRRVARRSVGFRKRPPVQGRADADRGAARAPARRDLGAARVSQPRA